MKERLVDLGYNARERVYVYTGAITGAAAPIVGARYLLFNDIASDNWLGELTAWGCAVLLNASTLLIKPHAPVPLYTAAIGSIVGREVAKRSKEKRREEENELEKLANE